MELACLEDSVPVGCRPSKGSRNAGAKREQTEGIEEAEDGSDYQLSSQFPFRSIGNPEEWPARSSERQRPDEGPWGCASESKVVIVLSQLQTRDLVPRVWDAISQDIMSRLDVETFLDLRIRCGKEVNENRRGDDDREERVCVWFLVYRLDSGLCICMVLTHQSPHPGDSNL